MVKRLIGTLFAAVTVNLAASTGVRSGPLEDGDAAFIKGDYATAITLWRPLAEQGNPGAEFKLGSLYQQGLGVPVDCSTAAAWYRKAGGLGLTSAQYALFRLYWEGTCLPKDITVAVRWDREAAEHGNAPAQYSLGRMYAMGQGVPQSNVLAYMWLALAMETTKTTAWAYPELQRQNIVNLGKQLDDLAAQMTADQVTEAKRLAREWVPAVGGK